MTLWEKQVRFGEMTCELLCHIKYLGYQFTLGHVLRCEQCHTGVMESTHKYKLAIDINLFKDKKYLKDGSGHDILHDFWDSIGGAPRIEGDLNHYSLEHNGVR